MNSHDWHTLASFGLLVTALAIFDKRMAVYAIGVAGAVIVVKNSTTVVGWLEGGKTA